MQEPWARIVSCRDHAGRVRSLVVFLAEDHDVCIRVPAGEVGRLQPADIQAVKQALTDAQVESIHRRKTW